MSIEDRIKSMRQTLGVEYVRPDPQKLDRFIESLWNNQSALEYLRNKRGLSNETIEHFKLGYDEQKDAIAIPIFKNKELINIKYRLLNPKDFKYTQEKDGEVWIYNEDGIDEGKKKGGILIVEGEFDLMSAWQVGIRAVVSPASGKDSYGIWLELLDSIPLVWIAYDNDKAGKEASFKLAERIKTEKCFEIEYPEGYKDANEYFQSYTRDDFLKLKENAKPYYKYQFKGLGDVIASLRNTKEEKIQNYYVPDVKFGKDWLVVVSGVTNVGKTTFAMNLANDFVSRGVSTLVFPFERGIDSVGGRFLQVNLDKSEDELRMLDDDEWSLAIKKCVNLPLYLSVPKKDDIIDTIVKSRRIFNTKVVIVDHLDYLVRHVSGNRESEISNTLQNLKRVAEEYGVLLIIITHIRKIEQAGTDSKRKPYMDDLKGSSSLSQDPETVIMLYNEDDDKSKIVVDVMKNKGEMSKKTYNLNKATGKMTLSSFDEF